MSAHVKRPTPSGASNKAVRFSTDQQQNGDKQQELTVCHIIGDWSYYQTSICLFATLYSALFAITVVCGPLLTPDMAFACKPDNSTATWLLAADVDGGQLRGECSRPDSANNESCTSGFLYDVSKLGRTLTNQVSGRATCATSPPQPGAVAVGRRSLLAGKVGERAEAACCE